MASKEEENFIWGNKLSQDENIGNPRRRRSEKAITKYSSCFVNRELITIGDEVIIDVEDEQESVCRIEGLYNDSSQENPCRAIIHWYFKKHELPTKVRDKIDHFLSEQYELFWPANDENNISVRGCIEDIDAETIREKCDVILLPLKCSRKTTGKYFVRYAFTIHNKLLSETELLCYLLAQKPHNRNKTTNSKETPKTSQAKAKTPLRSAAKRKASKSIPDETEVQSKFKRCLADSRKYGHFDTSEVIDLLSDVADEVFENDDNKSEASSYTEEQSRTPAVRTRTNSKTTPGITGNRKISEKGSNHCKKKTKCDREEGRKARRECIEEIEIEEKENNNNNVSKSRGKTKQNNTVARKTPRREVKTPGKTPQRGKKESKEKERKSNKKIKNVVTTEKGKKNKKINEHSDSDDHVISVQGDDDVHDVNYNPSADGSGKDSDSETEVEEEESGSEEHEEEEEEVFVSPPKARRRSTRTPSRSVKRSTTKRKQLSVTPKRTKKVSPKTPKSRRKSRLSFATPFIPVRAQSCKTPVTPLEKARASLHVSAVPISLPCREQQFDDICSFVEGKLSDDTGGCMYISGVPGTGKTATVHEVIRYLERMKTDEEVADFKFYEINGMKVTQPNQVYVMFYKFLTGDKVTADHASSLLDKYFNNSAKREEHIILLVDELDQLWTKKQDVMYHLFDWPTRRRSKLIVLAIANTMDLPERMMINRVSSRLGLTRMTFQPYTYSQLQEIVTSRIQELDAFEPDAVQLVARKVAALSGDARRCLDICRRAVEIAEQEAFSLNVEQELVGMPHVEKALNEMFSSPKIVAMKNLSIMEGFMLKSVLAEFRRTGLEEASFSGVYSQLVALSRIEGVIAPGSSLASAICNRLGAIRLLLVDSGRCDIQQRIRLNVNKDDILFALKTAKKETK